MMQQTRDLATVFNDAYSLSAPILLAEQHEFLLKSLEKHFAGISSGTLAVIGPGGQALPYSKAYENGVLGGSNRDRIKKILKNGRAIFVDYVQSEDKGGLDKEIQTFKSQGFFEKGYFNLGAKYPPEIMGSGPGPKTFSFLLNNARDLLRIESGMLDAIDATLSLHHAYVNRQTMERIFQDLYRTLKPGGMLHLGEGHVDMNYTEEKIIKIATDISNVLNKNIALTDNRERGSGYVLHALFEHGKNYSSLPLVDSLPQNNYANLTITEEGTVILLANRPNEIVLRPAQISDLAKKLSKTGYKQMFVFSDSLALPLIDLQMKPDLEKLVRPVDRYYNAVNARIFKGLICKNPELCKAMYNGIEFERGNAKRGIVEYFMGVQKIKAALRKAGFVNISSTKPGKVPLYNILAYRP